MSKFLLFATLCLALNTFASDNTDNKVILCEAICNTKTGSINATLKRFTVSNAGTSDASQIFAPLLGQCEAIKNRIGTYHFEIVSVKDGSTATMANSCYFQSQLPTR